MKKIIFLFFIISGLILTSSTVFCKDVIIYKSGGVRKVLTFWKLTYDAVHYQPAWVDPVTNKVYARLDCTGGGNETCSKSLYGSKGQTIIGKNKYYEKLIDEVCDEIMDLVDKSIFDGNETGSVSKKIRTKTIDGKEMTLAFTAAWSDADIKTGNVKYIIRINEIEL